MKLRSSPRVLAVLVALPLLGAHASARASAPVADDEARARAKALVERGSALYDRARYEEALVAFQDAAASYAAPELQFNVGLCYEGMGDYDAAIRAFETYLRNKPDAEDRANVERRVLQLRRLAEAAASPTPEPRREPAAPVVTPPEPPRSDPRPQPETVKDDGPAREGSRARVAGITMISVGAALAIGGGIGFGIPASRRSRRVDEVLEGGNPEALGLAQTQAIAEEGDRFRALQIAAISTGVAIAGAGVVALIVGRRRARGRMGVAPAAGAGAIGLSWEGRF